MSQSRDDEANRLLAQWGRLLQVRHELRSAGVVRYRIIYHSSWNAPEQFYDAELGYSEDDALNEAFIQNIEENLEAIEHALRAMGITVARPVFER